VKFSGSSEGTRAVAPESASRVAQRVEAGLLGVMFGSARLSPGESPCLRSVPGDGFVALVPGSRLLYGVPQQPGEGALRAWWGESRYHPR